MRAAVVIGLSLSSFSALAAQMLSEAENLGLQGVEPYAFALQTGSVLPETPHEVATLPFLQRLKRQSALKRSLAQMKIRALNKGFRMSGADWSFAAREAKELGCPEDWIRLLQVLAEPTLSRRESRSVQNSMARVLENYEVDELLVTYFVNGSHVQAEQLLSLSPNFPWAAFFNLRRRIDVTPEMWAEACAEYLICAERIGRIYGGICDEESAKAALPELLELTVRLADTQAARLLSSRQVRDQASVPAPSADELRALETYRRQRRRVREADFYRVPLLQALDYLMD